MDKIRILLCCGAGMSSGFLAQQMRIAAKKMNVVAKIEAKNKNSVQDDVNAIASVRSASGICESGDDAAVRAVSCAGDRHSQRNVRRTGWQRVDGIKHGSN